MIYCFFVVGELEENCKKTSYIIVEPDCISSKENCTRIVGPDLLEMFVRAGADAASAVDAVLLIIPDTNTQNNLHKYI